MAPIDELQACLDTLEGDLEEARKLTCRLATGQALPKQPPSGDDDNNDDNKKDDDDNDDDDDDETTAEDLAKETTELAWQIADDLRDAQDGYELLQEDVTDLLGEVSPASSATAPSLRAQPAAAPAVGDAERHERQRLVEGLRLFRAAIADAHRELRAANVAAQRRVEATRRAEQERLLAYYEEQSEEEEETESEGETASEAGEDEDEDVDEKPVARRRRHRPPPQHHAHTSPTANAAADVTAALRQTHARIAAEVARSDFAAQTLAESSRALAELGDRYAGGAGDRNDIATSLRSARSLVRGLVAAHKSDTWYLQTSLYLLLATAAWLVFRRLLYGPLWLLVWWPLRTLWAVAGTALWAAGQAGSAVGGSGRDNSTTPAIIDASSLASSAVASSPRAVTASVDARGQSSDGSRPASGGVQDDGGSLVEQVGRIVDSDAATNAQADDPGPNPMKRMWEEDVEAAKDEEQGQGDAVPANDRKKDEL